MTNKSHCLEFALSDNLIDTDGEYMKLIKNGVTYIYTTNGNPLSTDIYCVGIVHNGSFYSSSYGYSGLDKDMDSEIAAMNDRYTQLYNEELSKYNADNLVPVTSKAEKDFKSLDERIEEYKKYYVHESASASFFNDKRERSGATVANGTSQLKKAFTEYLTGGENYLINIAKQQIELKADGINFRILANIELQKCVEELKADEKFMRRVNLYHSLDATKMKNIKITLDVDGTILENFKAETVRLKAGLAGKYISEYIFTNAEIDRIKKAWNNRNSDGSYRPVNLTIDNIVKITYGRNTIYERRCTWII